jgi:glycosyltransferase involved in cell wall biosynthesis
MILLYNIAATWNAGGMERVLAEKANWLAEHGFKVVVVTTDQRGLPAAFPMDPSIECRDLGINYDANNGAGFASKVLQYPLKQWRHRRCLRKLLEEIKPDITVSMFNNEASFLPRIQDGSRKVLEVHFSRFKKLQYGRKGLWALADRWRTRQDVRTAAKYDRFVVLTEEDKGYWGELDNIRVIPNPRTFTFSEPTPMESRTVLAVGRYTYQKGFDLLLKAWRAIDTQGWTLRIAGSGDPLEDVPDNVITGPSTDILEEYRNAAFLVMSSRYEGLPMVLLEAQAAGLPIVAFACKCGPRDVLTDGVDGLLIPEGDIAALAAGMKRLMDDKELRRKMGAAAFRNSEKYDKERIMALWEKLFHELS